MKPDRVVISAEGQRAEQIMLNAFWQPQGQGSCHLGSRLQTRTDDMREAPSIPLIEALLSAAAVQTYDPDAAQVARGVFGNRVTLAGGNDEAQRCGLPGHRDREERAPGFRALSQACAVTGVVFDGRNLFTPSRMNQNRFTDYSIGRN